MPSSSPCPPTRPETDVIETWLNSDQPAVVFDFNGTLSDDEHILFDIFSELFRGHLGWAMTAEDYRDELLGRSDREIIERAVARHGGGHRAAAVAPGRLQAEGRRPQSDRGIRRAVGETVGG